MEAAASASAKGDGMTDRQAQVLLIIRRSFRKRGYAPTTREIAKDLGVNNPGGVQQHLNALERIGVIARERNRTRAIRLTDGTCPCCGKQIEESHEPA